MPFHQGTGGALLAATGILALQKSRGSRCKRFSKRKHIKD
ncbi:hypothetical protein B4098_3076 [Heyndrickxia coagulans]|uniref:Uncharacterized protein n=1 Tax=Heyndrickxia coagulans TaxID=1398 RepID=A0A150JUC3_HEYCO|nr:hypothetical protein B4098_3076 [Heyndrickxia coagulans]